MLQSNRKSKYNHVFGVIVLLLPSLFAFAAIGLFSVIGFNVFKDSHPVFALVVNTKQRTIRDSESSISLPSNDENISSGGSGSSPTNPSGSFTPIKDAETFPVIRWGQQWAVLNIDRYGWKNMPVYFGDDDKLLSRAVCMGSASRFPGFGKNCILSAHVTSYFFEIKNVDVGTKISLNTIYGEYEYKVTETAVFHVDDYRDYFLKDYGGDTLLLYTCYYPPGVKWSKTDYRYILVCKKTDGKEW